MNLSYTAFSYTVVPALDNILTDTAPLAVAELFIGYLPKRASLYTIQYFVCHFRPISLQFVASVGSVQLWRLRYTGSGGKRPLKRVIRYTCLLMCVCVKSHVVVSGERDVIADVIVGAALRVRRAAAAL